MIRSKFKSAGPKVIFASSFKLYNLHIPHLLVAALVIIFASIGTYLIFTSRAATTLTADFNNDNIVNVFDLSILASNWGKTGATKATGDTNGDGAVNIFDLSKLAGEWGQTVTPPTTGPTFNVLDYGAKGDGVTDDSTAIKNAFMAAHNANGGTVVFEAGKIYLVTTGWSMPPIRTNDWLGQTSPTVVRSGVITMKGNGAVIKYPNNTSRFSWLQSEYMTSPWVTFGNLVIDGFTFDNNFRSPTGDLGSVLWLHGNGSVVGGANYDNVTIKNVVMKNVPYRTAWDTRQTASGIYIISSFNNPNPGHDGYARNITITDSDISAQGKPIAIVCDNYGQSTYGYGRSPYMVDNIRIERVKTNNNGFTGTGIHLGSLAAGNRAFVSDIEATDSADNLIEIDAFNDVTVQNVKLSKASSGVGFTWFSFPYLSTTPTYRIYNVTYSGGNEPYWGKYDSLGNPVTIKPAARRNTEGMVVVATSATNLYSRSWGNMIMKGGNLTNGEVNAFSTIQPAIKYSGAFESVDIEDMNMTDIDQNNLGGALLYVKQLGTNTVPITLRNINYRTSLTGTFQPLPSSRMTFLGPYTLN